MMLVWLLACGMGPPAAPPGPPGGGGGGGGGGGDEDTAEEDCFACVLLNCAEDADEVPESAEECEDLGDQLDCEDWSWDAC